MSNIGLVSCGSGFVFNEKWNKLKDTSLNITSRVGHRDSQLHCTLYIRVQCGNIDSAGYSFRMLQSLVTSGSVLVSL